MKKILTFAWYMEKVVFLTDYLKPNLHKCHQLKKFIFLMVILVLSVFLYPDLANTQEPILLGCEINYPPFCFVDVDGQANGFSVELIRAALAAMGRKAAFRVGPWAEVKSWLEKGEVQALPLVGRTPERESSFDFSPPYMSLHGALVVQANTEDIQNLDDLKGRKVAVMLGDNAEEFIRRENIGAEIETTSTFKEALLGLSQGNYDAVVIQRLVALRLLQETGLKNLRIVNKPIDGFRQDFCFAVQEGDRETLALLNEGLALVIADGTYQYLHSKWFAAMELPTNRRIIIGGDYNFPPFEFINENGLPDGFNVDITRAIAKEMDLDIEIRLGPWAKISEDLIKGKIDAIQGMLYSPERGLIFDFTPPHSTISYVSIIRVGKGSPPASLDDLKGKQIIVQRGDIMHDFLQKNGIADQAIFVDSQEDALQVLAEGNYDCALVSLRAALYWIEKQGWNNLTLGREPFTTSDYCFAVNQNQKALLSQLNEGLNVISKTGEYRQIYEKWMGIYDVKALKLITILRYIAGVIIPLLALLFIFFLWSWMLRKQVNIRTNELHESERQKELILNSTDELITYYDTSLRIIWSNRLATESFGKTPKEVVGLHCYELWHQHHEPCDECPVLKALHDKAPREAINQTSDGRYWHMRGYPIFDKNGQVVALAEFTRDITEKKKMEEEHARLQAQLLQAQKMESVGRLAGGVAHDFNNMLQAILGHAELALNQVDPFHPLHEYLIEIYHAAERSANLTRQLLAFASKQTISPKILDLNQIVEGTLNMLRRLISEDIELDWYPSKDLWSVNIDPSQIDQILTNLCINARDAITGHGKITIETGNAFFNDNYCAQHFGYIPGEYVLMSVSDTGCGMDQETLANIFEPFFTTKGFGKGTGLGMPTVYGIVKQNNGFINVYSELGKGSTIKIYLPRFKKKSEPIQEGISDLGLKKGIETIFLVEDDQAILKMTEKMLKQLGYQVRTAQTPQEAINIAHEGISPIHLLITDVVMPDMSGPELTEKLQTVFPNLKVLYMSGYTSNVIAHQGVLDEDVHFIQKPFSIKDLSTKVRNILENII
ncbi:transporter substrate-binding domain-containing protein [Atribacter laminatus]|uniref:histidine kinase n=1 Tax=Atribacter laminatus TaxID=2847778 RepID=A0A7T1AMM1_ATRLM|nr:transporter substrate-binding domain-containing protein [Atribacter laminatus]QPM68698.1 Sensor kinase CckA [Atribacter laminatus]